MYSFLCKHSITCGRKLNYNKKITLDIKYLQRWESSEQNWDICLCMTTALKSGSLRYLKTVSPQVSFRSPRRLTFVCYLCIGSFPACPRTIPPHDSSSFIESGSLLSEDVITVYHGDAFFF